MNSLRVKVELALFIVVGLLVGLGYSIQRYVILPRLNPLEEKVAEKDMVRCVEAIRRNVVQVDAICAEWAARPDVLAIVEPGDTAEPPANLLRKACPENGLDLMFVLNTKGEVIRGSIVDSEVQTETEIAEFPSTQWPPTHPLLDRSPDGCVKGVLTTDSGPALVSAHAVVSAEGETLGTMVAGRMLDQALLTHIARQMAIAFQAWPVSDPALPESARNIIGDIADANLLHVTHVTDDLFRVYGTYPGIDGRPALLLQADVHRDVLSRAYTAMQEGLLAQVGMGLAALVILIILFRNVVMNPLTRLKEHTADIEKSKDLSVRLSMERNDEIGTLANEFDRMVAQLEEDVEKQQRVEAALRESEERYALAVRGANDGLWDWDLSSNAIHFSPRWKSMLGYTEEEVGDAPEDWLDKVHPADRDNVEAALDAHSTGQTAHFESEHRIKHKDSSYLWVLCRGLAIRDENGKPTRMAGSLSDITARKLIEEQLSHQALHDSLTALPNRALFLDRLGQTMRLARRHPDRAFAVLFVDLDRFKVINDGLGHVVGDQLLTRIAHRLGKIVRAGDTLSRDNGTIARFGGDEFVCLLDNIKDVHDATLVAERIQDALREPFQIGEHEVFTGASIGIALSVTGHETAEEVLRSADTAMYRAKVHGKGRYEIYDTDMHSRAVARLQLENDLRRAVERDEFCVHFQPIVSLRTGKIDALEALARWEHPQRGLVSPYEFVPVAEETGMIIEIGEKILRAACQQARTWQIKLPQAKDLHVSVNLSVKEFGKPDLRGAVESALLDTGLDPQYLKLEVTESAILENVDSVISTLSQLRAMDIQLAIDDFGTGYSSLSYLHRLPMNTLKIDRAFVRDMEMSMESLQIVKTIVLLAKALDMAVIAEGIETEEQLKVLRDLDCEYGQGYLFSKPLDPDAMTELLASDSSW